MAASLRATFFTALLALAPKTWANQAAVGKAAAPTPSVVGLARELILRTDAFRAPFDAGGRLQPPWRAGMTGDETLQHPSQHVGVRPIAAPFRFGDIAFDHFPNAHFAGVRMQQEIPELERGHFGNVLMLGDREYFIFGEIGER